MDRVDSVVVGAGLIGSSIAWRLAQAGQRVILLDRGEPGREASSAAVGLLLPETGREAGPELLQLWLASLARYPRFVEEVREVTNVAVEFRQCGRLHLALDDAEEVALQRRAQAQAAVHIPARVLSADEARRLEPAITPSTRSALFFPDHALVDNQRLSITVPVAAAIAGVQIRSHETVTALALTGGRVEGVETSHGRIAADSVVIAAGCWANFSSKLGAPLAQSEKRELALWQRDGQRDGQRDTTGSDDEPVVRPAKGEVIALQVRPRPFDRIVSIASGGVVARSDGQVIVGGTMVDGGFSKHVSAKGVAELLQVAVTAIPSLSEARFVEAWAGLRPRSPDQQPLIGPGEIQGVYWAIGHFKTGILSAPATADVVSSMILGRPSELSVDSLSPRRFGL